MKLEATFDDKELQRALTQYISYSKRSAPEILEKQMTSLAIGAKGVKGLFQEALSTRRATVAEIRQLPTRLDYRIKRAHGFTVKKEIARRIASAGFYQASGWVIPGRFQPRGKGGVVKTQRGSISKKGGINPSITIKNSSPKAFEFGSRTGYIQRALNARAKDMLKYVEKKMASDAKKLSLPKPRFTSLAELMRI